MHNLQKALEQIERDIQTKKLSKDEERKLVARTKEIATKCHTLKVIHKKEDQYRTISAQYDQLKDQVKRIFKLKEEYGYQNWQAKGKPRQPDKPPGRPL